MSDRVDHVCTTVERLFLYQSSVYLTCIKLTHRVNDPGIGAEKVEDDEERFFRRRVGELRAALEADWQEKERFMERVYDQKFNLLRGTRRGGWRVVSHSHSHSHYHSHSHSRTCVFAELED